MPVQTFTFVGLKSWLLQSPWLEWFEIQRLIDGGKSGGQGATPYRPSKDSPWLWNQACLWGIIVAVWDDFCGEVNVNTIWCQQPFVLFGHFSTLVFRMTAMDTHSARKPMKQTTTGPWHPSDCTPLPISHLREVTHMEGELSSQWECRTGTI